ncbi:hypothetical protein [Parapedobacter lycopersici]|nr:hypothetical protein [Parapedobacter lycopersici]
MTVNGGLVLDVHRTAIRMNIGLEESGSSEKQSMCCKFVQATTKRIGEA